MRSIIYLVIGIFFGIVLFKSEAASWFRIYEMFRFGSFHMYGIIGTAVGPGIIIIQLIKRKKIKSLYGEDIYIPPKERSFSRYMFGGIIFWTRMGIDRSLPRAYVCTFGSRLHPHINCHCFSYFRNFFVWGGKSQITALD